MEDAIKKLSLKRLKFHRQQTDLLTAFKIGKSPLVFSSISPLKRDCADIDLTFSPTPHTIHVPTA